MRPLVNEFQESLSKRGDISAYKHPGDEALLEMTNEIKELWDEYAEKIMAIEESTDDPDKRLDELTLLLVALSLEMRTIVEKWGYYLYDEMLDDEEYRDIIVSGFVTEAMVYFKNFTEDIKNKLSSSIDNWEKIFTSFLWRATMYAGTAWILYNEFKVWGQDPNSIWSWMGPNDARTCAGCRAEIEAGPRPLFAIVRRPGQCECGVNRRCELVPA